MDGFAKFETAYHFLSTEYRIIPSQKPAPNRQKPIARNEIFMNNI
jgi:hypothetical protein